MVKYIDHIIKCSILPVERTGPVNTNAPLASLNENDFAQKLDKDSNAVASNCQMRAISHIANFEYGAAATGTCRFDFPRSRVGSTAVTEHEGIEIYQNNVWVNLWSPAFCIADSVKS